MSQKNENKLHKERWIVKPDVLVQYNISPAESNELLQQKEEEYLKMRQVKVEKKK